ncbi:ribonuclease E/G [Clostridium cylindrosporum]|uniref:Ribonuclease G n=1 Tax=Clostridium cylindrosporum DSM 605 TaxID=1121307 RepID=A0A0J8D628_CLOCY|nr:ribonuclease E/G [Clostridium cylindrosporum]KMT21550.1 ribonuclease G [Clostridium cylindrosporum DSM 605]
MNLIIDIGIAQSRALLLRKEKPVSIYTEDYSSKNISGNIYKGRVENITESLGCAFVNIGESKTGMLHFDECTHTIKKGEELLVQVIREPSGNKGARLSMKLTLPSKNSVLLVDCNDINISRNITDSKRRSELLSLGKRLTKGEEALGIIFRTSCINIHDEEIINEYLYTKKTWDKINSSWKYIKGESLLFEANNFIDYIKREYITSSIEKIYINREDESDEIKRFVKENSFEAKVLSIEESIDKLNLLKGYIEYSVKRNFDASDEVNIVIDETEALTIIDVNFASTNKSKDLEKCLLDANIKAVEKISQVISLKSSSGIILIDFINMKKEESKKVLEGEVERCFKKYGLKAKIHGFTKLGLLEVSKAKKSRVLRDVVYRKDNPNFLNPFYSVKNLENDILNMIYKNSKTSFNVFVSEDIYEAINIVDFIDVMKKVYSVKIETKKIRDFNGYYIGENLDVDFARISYGKRTLVGKIESFNEDDTSFSIKVIKKK